MKMFCLFPTSPKMKYQIRKMSTDAKNNQLTKSDSSSIKVIGSFNLDAIDNNIYCDTIDSILKNFPSYKSDDIYREVKMEADIEKPADRYFYIEFTKLGCEQMRGLYSYLNFYLLAIAAVGKIFVLQENDFGVPDDLLEGKEKVFVNCGVGYATIPMKVIYSHYHLCDAVESLSKGFKEGKMKWFVHSIARVIGMTSESARNKEMRRFVESVFDPKEFTYDYPSDGLIVMFKNWSKMSKFARSADDEDNCVLEGGITITKQRMRSILSLLNGKDGSKAEKNDKKVSAPASMGSVGKCIQPSKESKQCGGKSGISTLSFTSTYAGCGVRRQMRDDRPVLTSEESCVAELTAGKQSRMLGCGMMRQSGGRRSVFGFQESGVTGHGYGMMRQWGGRCSGFGFDESGITGHGVLGLGMMTQWGGKRCPVFIPEQRGVTELACNQTELLGCGMMRQLGCGMMRWQECPITTFVAQSRFLMSAPRLLKMFVRRM